MFQSWVEIYSGIMESWDMADNGDSMKCKMEV